MFVNGGLCGVLLLFLVCADEASSRLVVVRLPAGHLSPSCGLRVLLDEEVGFVSWFVSSSPAVKWDKYLSFLMYENARRCCMNGHCVIYAASPSGRYRSSALTDWSGHLYLHQPPLALICHTYTLTALVRGWRNQTDYNDE